MKRLNTVIIVVLAMAGLHACKSSSQKEKVAKDTFLNDVKDTTSTVSTAPPPSQPADKEYEIHPPPGMSSLPRPSPVML